MGNEQGETQGQGALVLGCGPLSPCSQIDLMLLSTGKFPLDLFHLGAEMKVGDVPGAGVPMRLSTQPACDPFFHRVRKGSVGTPDRRASGEHLGPAAASLAPVCLAPLGRQGTLGFR